MLPFIITDTAITIFPSGAAPLSIDSSHVNFKAVRDAIQSGASEADIVALASVATFIKTVSNNQVEVNEYGVTYGGVPVNNYLSNVMVKFFLEGLPIDHFVLFLKNLMSNPSRTAIQELYLFLESAKLPITEDGCFLAYKAVRFDFKDKHSGKFDNSPGAILEMPRNEVDDVRDRTCSYGFHAAAYEYAKNFLGSGSDRMVVVKINPADVVSVPSDYNNQKLRTCRYEVLHEIVGAFDTMTGKLHASQVASFKDDAELNWWEAYEDEAYDDGEDTIYSDNVTRAMVSEALDNAHEDIVDAIVNRLG